MGYGGSQPLQTIHFENPDITNLTTQLAQKANQADVYTKSSQPTTLGKWWSTTFDELTMILNGKTESLKLRPMYTSKKIVFIGSSSTEGNGTSGIPKIYHQLLASTLSAKGYEVHSRGIGGDNTTNVINRFYNDVATVNPDFVVIAMTLGNEGIVGASDKDAIYKQFKNNILQLVKMVQQIGAIPIVFNQAPTQQYDSTIYRYARQLNAEFDAMGFHVLDWCSAVDDLNGQPISALAFDSLHYNDTGHQAIFKSIPPTMFERIGFQSGVQLASPKGYINLGANTDGKPLEYYPEYTLESFTAFLRIQAQTNATAVGIAGFSLGVDRFVLRTDGQASIVFADGTEVILGTVTDGSWHSLAISYHIVSNEVRLYRDGVFIQSITKTITFDSLVVGGRQFGTGLQNANLKDVVLYRTRIKDERVKSLHEGVISQTGLELFSPLHDKITSSGTRLMNLAPTTGNLKISDTATTIVSANAGWQP